MTVNLEKYTSEFFLLLPLAKLYEVIFTPPTRKAKQTYQGASADITAVRSKSTTEQSSRCCKGSSAPVSEDGNILDPVSPTLHCPNSNHKSAYL